MRMKIIKFFCIGMLILSIAQCGANNYSSPRATLKTCFRAIRHEDRNLCISCFSKKDQPEVVSHWDDSQLPNAFDYTILSENIGYAAASIIVELKTDHSETQTFWFIKEGEGWKIILEKPADSLFEQKNKIEWHSKQLGDGWGIPALAQGLVIVGIGNPYHSSIHALNAKTGEVQWTYDTDIYCTSGAFTNGKLIFIASGNNFYCLEAKTGQLKWKFETGQFIQSNPCLAQDIVYFCSGDGNLYAVHVSDGSLKWKAKLEQYASYSPILFNNIVYAGNHLFDASTGENVEPVFKKNWPPPLVNSLGNGFVGMRFDNTGESRGYIPHSIGYEHNYLYKFSEKSGDVVWKLYVGINSTSPVVLKDGVIYYTSADNRVHAIDEEIDEKKAIKPEKVNTTYEKIKGMKPEKRIEILNKMMEDPTIDETSIYLLIRIMEEDPYWDVGTAEKIKVYPIREIAGKVLSEKIWFAKQAFFVSGNKKKLEDIISVIKRHGKDKSLQILIQIADFMMRGRDIEKLDILINLAKSNIPEIKDSACRALKKLTL